MQSPLLSIAGILVVFLQSVRGAYDIGYTDDSDLTSFVTRPEIRVPLFNVTLHHADKVEPVYWFLAPYHTLTYSHVTGNGPYQPCQTGPTIYDLHGELVWTGACMYSNRIALDFRLFQRDGKQYLSFILFQTQYDLQGHGEILDSSYTRIKEVHAAKDAYSFNMHEFNVVDEGTKALHFSVYGIHAALDGIETSREAGWLSDFVIREVDIESGHVGFKWLASDHIDLTESKTPPGGLDGPPPKGWNYLHLNSVNKNSDGDYLVSARFTDCIFKISGHDGSILWRLGGLKSSFQLDGFNFSRQHDAQWISFNDDLETITFLDNGSDNYDPPYQTSNVSSGLLVELDKRTMTARVLKRWTRPDQQLSRLRGNLQNLPGGNVLLGWSDNAYVSEHSADGELLAEGRFTSDRFVTYRAYKFNFTGMPAEAKPILKAFAHGATRKSSSTAIYTSWNGATDIDSWVYYCKGPGDVSTAIGKTARTGFETTFYISGHECEEVFAEAIDKDGAVLGTTIPSAVETPKHWRYELYDGAVTEASKMPIPPAGGMKSEL